MVGDRSRDSRVRRDLKGKIVLDCTNLLAMSPGGCISRSVMPPGEQVASRFDHRRVMFVASNYAASKRDVMPLVGDLGFEAIDAVPMRAACLLEPGAMLWIGLPLKRGQGHAFALALPRHS